MEAAEESDFLLLGQKRKGLAKMEGNMLTSLIQYFVFEIFFH
jgi:hypothetical protein